MKVTSTAGLTFRGLCLVPGENPVDEAVWRSALDGSARLRQLVEQGAVVPEVETEMVVPVKTKKRRS